MNELNYGSREACERLVKAGIVLETEKVWIYARNTALKGADFCWRLFNRDSLMAIEATEQKPSCIIPAPSMAEMWRMIPGEIIYKTMRCSPMIWKSEKGTCAGAGYWWHEMEIESFFSINPTDALIDLLIWVSQRKEGT